MIVGDAYCLIEARMPSAAGLFFDRENSDLRCSGERAGVLGDCSEVRTIAPPDNFGAKPRRAWVCGHQFFVELRRAFYSCASELCSDSRKSLILLFFFILF
jgi:hypothetical protein